MNGESDRQRGDEKTGDDKPVVPSENHAPVPGALFKILRPFAKFAEMRAQKKNGWSDAGLWGMVQPLAENSPANRLSPLLIGAGNRVRTGDLNLGKVAPPQTLTGDNG